MIYEFSATQNLHGYDKPWAPSGNDNNIMPLDISRTVNGITFEEAEDQSYRIHGKTTLQFSTSYLIGSGTGALSLELEADVSYVFRITTPNASFRPYLTGAYITITLEDDTTINVNVNTPFTLEQPGKSLVVRTTLSVEFGGPTQPVGTTFDYTLYPQIAKSDTVPTDWTPYSNICMPEGFNIWDPYNDEFIQVYAGYVNANTRELYLRPVYEEYAGEELVGPWMSSLDPYDEDTTPTEGAFVIDFGGELTSFEITPFMLQTLLDSLGIRQHFTDGAGLLTSLMDQAQGRVRSEDELLHLSRPLQVIPIGDQLPAGLKIRPISKDVLPGLPGKFIR